MPRNYSERRIKTQERCTLQSSSGLLETKSGLGCRPFRDIPVSYRMGIECPEYQFPIQQSVRYSLYPVPYSLYPVLYSLFVDSTSWSKIHGKFTSFRNSSSFPKTQIALKERALPEGPGKTRTHGGGNIVSFYEVGRRRQNTATLLRAARTQEMLLKIFRNIFRVQDTKFVSATNVARVAKRGNIWETRSRQQCCRHNVSSFWPALKDVRGTFTRGPSA